MLKYHIQTIELSAAAPAIVFNNIPQIYDDIQIVCSLRSSQVDVWGSLLLSINGTSTLSGGANRHIQGAGSGTPSSSSNAYPLDGIINGNGSPSGTFASTSIYISNYRSSANKLISTDSVTENNATLAYQRMNSSAWNNSASVTSVSLDGNGFNFLQYSSASLYGIKRGADGVTQVPAAFGGTVTTSGGYTYHTFTSSGSFTANRSLNTEALIIAGGGGAERGGGGAGGVTFATASISTGVYPVSVGAGGAAGNNTNGGNGGNSTFNGISAIGGGGGGTSRAAGNSGGSGGGGGHENGNTSFVAAGGAATSGQGFAGGSGVYQGSGGGGGAGGVGQNGTGNPSDISGGRGGDAGLGTNAYSVWATATGTGESGRYASGGGGNGYDDYHGKFALGGGGGSTDGNYATRRFALANMGGGASDYSAGGSGIVIIRYPTPA